MFSCLLIENDYHYHLEYTKKSPSRKGTERDLDFFDYGRAVNVTLTSMDFPLRRIVSEMVCPGAVFRKM